MTAIDAIINPINVSVASVANPTTGTRYLLLHDIGSYINAPGDGAIAWRGADGVDLVAHANDIIQYNGSHWVVSFDSQSDTSLQYVSNLTTGIQYKWNGDQWLKSFEGEYKEGLWTLVL